MALRRRRPERRGTPADLLVVGLANPGPEYAETRHNAGQWVVEELARRHGARLRRSSRERADVDEVVVAGRRLALAVPTTYMNESGGAVAPLVRRFGITDLSRLVVVHDELDLPVGRVKLKLGGGTAGNNGLKSVRASLRADAFARLRLGIGKPEPGTMSGADYVLRRPSKREREALEEAVRVAADAVESVLATDVATAMNHVNAG